MASPRELPPDNLDIAREILAKDTDEGLVEQLQQAGPEKLWRSEYERMVFLGLVHEELRRRERVQEAIARERSDLAWERRREVLLPWARGRVTEVLSVVFPSPAQCAEFAWAMFPRDVEFPKPEGG